MGMNGMTEKKRAGEKISRPLNLFSHREMERRNSG
jgi:hypothetical protein